MNDDEEKVRVSSCTENYSHLYTDRAQIIIPFSHLDYLQKGLDFYDLNEEMIIKLTRGRSKKSHSQDQIKVQNCKYAEGDAWSLAPSLRRSRMLSKLFPPHWPICTKSPLENFPFFSCLVLSYLCFLHPFCMYQQCVWMGPRGKSYLGFLFIMTHSNHSKPRILDWRHMTSSPWSSICWKKVYFLEQEWDLHYCISCKLFFFVSKVYCKIFNLHDCGHKVWLLFHWFSSSWKSRFHLLESLEWMDERLLANWFSSSESWLASQGLSLVAK